MAAGRSNAHHIALTTTGPVWRPMIGSTAGGVLKEPTAQGLPYILSALLALVATMVMIRRVREPR